jgi:hypothetical protein
MRNFPMLRSAAYRAARDMWHVCHRLAEELPAGSELRGALLENAMVVPLAIARSAAELTAHDTIWTLRVARCAARDVLPLLDELTAAGPAAKPIRVSAARELTERTVELIEQRIRHLAGSADERSEQRGG